MGFGQWGNRVTCYPVTRLPADLAASNDTPEPENLFPLVYEAEAVPPHTAARNPVSWAPTVSHMNNFTFFVMECA